MITRENCRGVWAPILTEWDENDRFDEMLFAENARAFAAAGVHTVYTSGTDGEFYALSEAEFRTMVRTLVAALDGCEATIAIGATAANTRDALRLIEYCAQAGAHAVMPAFPFWLEMRDDERRSFLADCCRAAGPLGVLHYNTPRAKYSAGPADYRAWMLELPDNFVGSKSPMIDVPLWCQFLEETPDLAHLCMEATAVPVLFAGGRAFISATLCLLDPRLAVELFNRTQRGEWKSALALQLACNRVEHLVSNRILRAKGFRGAALSKAILQAAQGSIRTHNRVRLPYLAVPHNVIDEVRHRLVELMPNLYV